jgi:hypothetical protein
VEAAWHLPAHQSSTRRVCLILLLCHSGAGAVSVHLPLQTTGVLWAPATSSVAALPHSSGDLHPLLCVVCLCVPLVNLFRLFQVLRWSEKASGLVGAYYL